jgi:hypothetical protein
MREIDAAAKAGNSGLQLNRRGCRVFTRLSFSILLVLYFSMISASANADDSTSEPTVEQLHIQIDILKDQIVDLKKSNANLQASSPSASQELYNAWVQLKKREYAYYGQLMDSNVKTFLAQQIASYVVLFLVFVVVSAGIVFSGFQLWKSVTTGVQSDTNLEVSASSVRVTSSVVGIVVLAISLAFLFIYAHEVYHIKELGTSSSDPRAPGQ